MEDICIGTTWVVWLDKQGKWHSSEECWGWTHPLADELARRHAKALVGLTSGTAEFIGTAVVVYCIHIKGRYPAIKMAKQAYKARLLVGS